ncbi:hypothetical protein PENTCL1PPCAC_26659, partial [Pristionchus entomophagus]
MSSFFPFLTSTPRKRSTSTDSITLDSSAIDVDRISLVSHSSSTIADHKDDSSDLYMSVQASPTGSCEEESYQTAGSTQTGESKLRLERRFNEKILSHRPNSVFPDGPSWLDLQSEILTDSEERATGKSDEWDLFDLGSIVSGVREELRWMKSLAKDEQMRKLMAEFDSSYNPLEGPSSTTDESDLVVRLKNTPTTSSVVIPSLSAGISEMTIEKKMRIPPHEIAQRVLLHDLSTVFPRDEGTEEWLTRAIDLSNMLLVPSLSSSSPSSSMNRSLTTVYNGSKGTETNHLSTVGGQRRVKDEWILDLHPARGPQKILESQNNVCAGCGRILEGEYAKRIRYCDYYGAVFCACCSFAAKGIVPARILCAWNFREFPLSDRAAAFIDQIRDKPVIRMREAAPLLMDKIRSLKMVSALRPRLKHAATYVRHCALAERIVVDGTGMSLSNIFSLIPTHLIEEDDVFSLNDLEKLYKGELLPQLEGAFSIAKDHVERCRRPENELISVCKDRAFTCWLCCSESDLIFSFQSADRVRRCEACGSFAHNNCFRKAQKDNRGFEPECAKCKRMQESRL